MAIATVKLESTALRMAMIAGAVVCLFAAGIAAKWFFGSTVAARAIYKEIADVAVDMTPADPRAHFTSATLLEKTFLPDDLPRSLTEYELAVANAPGDFRYWLELGQAHARRGNSVDAEKALRRALELAPNYSRVQWAIGNFYLREGRNDEAFTEIRKAAQGDPSFANSAVGSAWQIFGGDVEQIRGYVGDSANLKAAFAVVLAREKLFDQSLAVWLDVPVELRRTDFKANGEDIYQKMIAAKKFRTAFGIFVANSATDDKTFALGRVTNGGFEAENPKVPSMFEWQIAEGAEPQIGIDNTQKHNGSISLKMIFNSTDGKSFRSFSQTVAIEQNRRYAFEVFYKSELKSGATLKWEVVDAADPKVIYATTDAVATSSDWTQLKTEFATPPNAEAVVVRLVRVPCQTTQCAISGRVWFDDVSLSALNYDR